MSSYIRLTEVVSSSLKEGTASALTQDQCGYHTLGSMYFQVPHQRIYIKKLIYDKYTRVKYIHMDNGNIRSREHIRNCYTGLGQQRPSLDVTKPLSNPYIPSIFSLQKKGESALLKIQSSKGYNAATYKVVHVKSLASLASYILVMYTPKPS